MAADFGVDLLYLGQKFRSYDEFVSFFQEYQRKTKQIFCVSYSKTADSYNRLRTKKINRDLKYATIQYICKCGGKERHRGTGIRPVQRYDTKAVTSCDHVFKTYMLTGYLSKGWHYYQSGPDCIAILLSVRAGYMTKEIFLY